MKLLRNFCYYFATVGNTFLYLRDRKTTWLIAAICFAISSILLTVEYWRDE